MVMALNMTDEAKARGVTVDHAALAAALGVPVVATVATGGEGVAALTDAIGKATAPAPLLRYDPVLERDIARVEARIAADCPHPRLAARGLAILAIGRDPEVDAWLAAQANSAAVRALLAELTAATGRDSLPARLARERGGAAEATSRVCAMVVLARSQESSVWLSHSAAESASHGASTGTEVDIWSMSVVTASRSGRIVGSGGVSGLGAAVKAIYLPSGDQTGPPPMACSILVSGLASPPSTGITAPVT